MSGEPPELLFFEDEMTTLYRMYGPKRFAQMMKDARPTTFATMSTELTAPTKVEVDPINTALVAAGVTSAAIEQLAKDYGALAARTQPIETPEEYEVVKRAQLSCRDIRTAVTAALKTERDEAVKYQKFVIQEEKRILAQIATTEEPLKKLREEYDKREELKVQEAARLWMERMELRKQAAYDIGFQFDGANYLLDKEDGTGPWVMREDQVAGMAMSDEAFYSRLEEISAALAVTRSINQELAEKAAEEQRLKDEAIKAEADRIAKAQAEVERKQKEMEEREQKMNARINEMRKNELIAIGMVVEDHPGRQYFNELALGEMTRDIDALHLESDEDWHYTIEEAKQRKVEWDNHVAQQEFQMKMRDLEKSRRSMLLANGYIDLVCGGEELLSVGLDESGTGVFTSTLATLPDPDFEALLDNGRQVLAERKRKHDEHVAQVAIEQERLRVLDEAAAKKRQEEEAAAKASDKDKVIAIAKALYAAFIEVPLPELKSATGKSAMKVYSRQLAEIHASMVKLSKEL